MNRIRILLLHAASEDNATFSYQHTWSGQFLRHPRFECTLVNLSRQSAAARVGAEARIRTWRGDAVVLLHSVFSNACLLTGRRLAAVQALDRPTAYFIGNEYKLMPEKMRFCDDLRVRLLVSQSSSPTIHRLYGERLGCAVIGMPNSGLDIATFGSTTDHAARPIDIGYRAQDAPLYLGHTERRDIATYFQARADALGVRVDISMDPAERFSVPEWAAFLNRCKAQLGTEAGGDYFDLGDRTRLAVNTFVASHPDATLDDVRTHVLAAITDAVPLRIISSRHVEAAGTKTTQILFEGEYDGYFQPDVHYIPLKKDFSNAAEAMAKFRDPRIRQLIADNAYTVARETLTYERLLDRFAAALEGTL